MLARTDYLNLSQPFVTESGAVIDEPVVAFEQYGRSDGPVIFIAHGGLSDAHAAGRYEGGGGGAVGWWDGLIGPGKVFDTERCRVLATNALGSMFGSSSPATVSRATGLPWGPDFPALTLLDQVRFQRAFLDELGVEHLHLMAGPSMGSLHTLTMAAEYPDFVDAVVAVATAGRTPPPALTVHHFMMNAIRLDPAFAGGRYSQSQPLNNLRVVFQLSKFFYLAEAAIKEATWDVVPERGSVGSVGDGDGVDRQRRRSANVAAYLEAGQEERIRQWDPNSMVTVLSAINTHDLGRGSATYEDGVRRIVCPALLMNMDTDGEFQPCWAKEVVDVLEAVRPGQARFRLVTSKWGHLGCLLETEQLSRHIGEFMRDVEAGRCVGGKEAAVRRAGSARAGSARAAVSVCSAVAEGEVVA